MKSRRTLSKLTLAAVFAAGVSHAQTPDPYVIGVSAAMSGGASGTYSGQVEGMRLYFERLNAAGGINGRQVNLVVLDDQGEASRAAANARRFLTRDRVGLIVSTSTSATFAPIIGDAARAGVPVLFAGSVCPQETMPPADRLLFCSTGFSAIHDSVAIIDFITEEFGTDVRVGFAGMGIPISRAGVERAEQIAIERGASSVGVQIAPPGTSDFSAYALNLREAEVVMAWAPWSFQVGMYNALRRSGWDGAFVAAQLAETEEELFALRDPKLFIVGSSSMLFEGLPAGDEVIAAVQAAGSQTPPTRMLEGWVGAVAVEAALRNLDGADGTPAAAQAALSDIEIDTRGLRGGPIVWRDRNHFRTQTYYKVFRWSEEDGALVVVRDWVAYETE